jgi:hypothetical protein
MERIIHVAGLGTEAFAGLFLGMFVSVGLGLAVDRRDPSFRTPEEVESYLGGGAGGGV